MLIPLKDENPTIDFPVVTVSIIAANFLVFMYQMSLGTEAAAQEFVFRLGAIPYEIIHLQDIQVPDIVPPPFTLLTSMFLHGGIAHLLGNMLYLWIFGNNVEDSMGSFRYFIFYLICGIAAGLSQAAAHADATTPMIGASGAIAGILGAYAVLYPRTRVLTLIFLFIFIRIIYVPAIVILGFWFVLQILSASSEEGGVAWFAHIGGFVTGLTLVWVFLKRRVSPERRAWY